MPSRNVVIDQMGNEVLLNEAPKRIVSLVPSQTELLWALDLEEETIGITKFCIHPENWFKNKQRVGGTKTVHIETIKSLKPDLIIANKEENEQNQIDELQSLFPVYVSDIYNLKDNLQMIEDIGLLSNRTEKSRQLQSQIEQAYQQLSPNKELSALYLIWHDPIMSVGSLTYIHTMMKHAGLKNVLGEDHGTRYPELSVDLIRQLQPELILLSSEPFPFGNKHLGIYQKWFPNSKIYLVDGEMFSWYGYRSLLAPDYFREFVSTF